MLNEGLSNTNRGLTESLLSSEERDLALESQDHVSDSEARAIEDRVAALMRQQPVNTSSAPARKSNSKPKLAINYLYLKLVNWMPYSTGFSYDIQKNSVYNTLGDIFKKRFVRDQNKKGKLAFGMLVSAASVFSSIQALLNVVKVFTTSLRVIYGFLITGGILSSADLVMNLLIQHYGRKNKGDVPVWLQNTKKYFSRSHHGLFGGANVASTLLTILVLSEVAITLPIAIVALAITSLFTTYSIAKGENFKTPLLQNKEKASFKKISSILSVAQISLEATATPGTLVAFLTLFNVVCPVPALAVMMGFSAMTSLARSSEIVITSELKNHIPYVSAFGNMAVFFNNTIQYSCNFFNLLTDLGVAIQNGITQQPNNLNFNPPVAPLWLAIFGLMSLTVGGANGAWQQQNRNVAVACENPRPINLPARGVGCA